MNQDSLRRRTLDSGKAHFAACVFTNRIVCSDIEAGAAYQDRLEGIIMRSQLLVLLQNQVFTDSQGRLLSGELPSQRLEMQLDCQMRSFYRTRYMHR